MNSLVRFSNRADYYALYRPGYPDAVVDLLRQEAGWTPRSAVADIGAGTGISSELFLRHGNQVWAVEPNPEMRAVAEKLGGKYPLQVIDGTAESTTLAAASVDFVVAATAFHWFDAALCRAEFRRILEPHGFAVVLWNERRTTKSPLLEAYEELLLRFGTDYKNKWGKQRRDLAGSVKTLFEPFPVHCRRFDNSQHLDFDGLRGRLLSSSYAPLPGEPKHDDMIVGLRALFDRFQQTGAVTIDYETTVYWGKP
jgi:SAM-dependent methyltransferase